MAVAPITEAELTRAIEQTLVVHGKLPTAEAGPTARLILAYFGHGDTMLDNKLSSEDRDRFYLLEEEGLLTSEEEDATVARGKTWRIHYWLLKKSRVREAGQSGAPPPVAGSEAVYREMDQDQWKRDQDPTARPPTAR